jgi:hypothetical protein
LQKSENGLKKSEISEIFTSKQFMKPVLHIGRENWIFRSNVEICVEILKFVRKNLEICALFQQ